MADANPLGALRGGPVGDFGEPSSGKIPASGAPPSEVRKTDFVSSSTWAITLLVALLLDAVIVGFWHLDFIHEPKLHGSILQYGGHSLSGRQTG